VARVAVICGIVTRELTIASFGRCRTVRLISQKVQQTGLYVVEMSCHMLVKGGMPSKRASRLIEKVGDIAC
jgi:hypothetical protein